MLLFDKPNPTPGEAEPNHGAVQALLNAAPLMGHVQADSPQVAAQNHAMIQVLLNQPPAVGHGQVLAYLHGPPNQPDQGRPIAPAA